jgi:hypothetical protein
MKLSVFSGCRFTTMLKADILSLIVPFFIAVKSQDPSFSF